ncbi:hypothetical protein [Actinomadura rayongensis]|uniref:Uncharacterized protein n=1 Tax=Actinomadura rayongensis TaxID=1429076 RepID=A0A6I4WII3_9ACTN|nr:hypothetical protein [Actinomadura rayongensis]MXQ68165.1 hypothetical protein [Actinomadura rayongensis]
MHKRATNALLAGVTGSALAGMLVAGVAVASGDDQAPKETAGAPVAAQELARDRARVPSAVSQDTAKPSPKPSAKKRGRGPKALLSGRTTASYFWDDGSGVNGDTGAPASGRPMQKGLFASPSWPMNTKVRVSYNGRSVTGFVGDRGPGAPSHNGVMLDLDTYTFRYLLDGEKPASKYEAGTGEGHLQGLRWEVLQWGSGAGTRGAPQPFGS